VASSPNFTRKGRQLQSPKRRFHTVLYHFNETVDIVLQEFDYNDDDNNNFVLSGHTPNILQNIFGKLRFTSSGWDANHSIYRPKFLFRAQSSLFSVLIFSSSPEIQLYNFRISRTVILSLVDLCCHCVMEKCVNYITYEIICTTESN